MASSRFGFSIIKLRLFLFFFTIIQYPVQGIEEEDSLFVNAQKVNLSIYYETLSPPCANFVVQHLSTIFNNHLIDIINLKMVPWGSAHVNRANNSIVCQNGHDECELNTIQACAINVWNDANKYYALIYCIEFFVIEGRHHDWRTCFDSLGLSDKPILECSKSSNGTKLQVANGYETIHLNPPHMLLPWVVVNNQPLGNDYANFTAFICNAYKGNTPSSCKSTPAKIG